jgi:hypothetical protein
VSADAASLGTLLTDKLPPITSDLLLLPAWQPCYACSLKAELLCLQTITACLFLSLCNRNTC